MSVPLRSHALRDADAAPIRAPRRSFARRRLLLGISGVGGTVVVCAGWLVLLLRGVPAVPSLTSAAASARAVVATAVLCTLTVFLAHAVLVAAIEFVGGARVVRERPSVTAWLRGWARGVLAQALLLAALTALASAGTVLGGTAGLVGAVLVGSTLLLAAQGFLARLVARLPVSPLEPALEPLARAHGIRSEAVRVVDAPDQAFVGGWVGLGTPALWIPRAWTDVAHRSLLAVQFARRHAQFTSGARRRGVLRAVLWPALGLALFVPLLPSTPDTPAFWLALPAVSTLWMFVGVLLLPALSRPVVYNADRVAAERLGREATVQAIRQLDAWQDDEPERSPGIEFVFHPVPSRGNRERALQHTRPRTLGGAHQLTRLSLYSALAAGSLLGRVVHCNIGRPPLWVVLPGD